MRLIATPCGKRGREISRLRRDVSGATRRLNELERGRRIAKVAEAVRRLRTGGVQKDHGVMAWPRVRPRCGGCANRLN